MTPLKPLTRREWEVLEHLLKGRSNKQIALALDISIRTVEFHLKNIYAKHDVASRVELILLLGGTPARPARSEKPVESTVAPTLPIAENGNRPSGQAAFAKHRQRPLGHPHALSMIGREIDMKNLLSKHTAAGLASALLAGLLWVALLRGVGNMSVEEIKLWIAPMLLVWIGIGAAAGLAGKRSGISLLRVGFASLAATGFSPLAVLPLMGFVVLPFAKLLERIGLINGASMPRETASTLAILAMLLLWLVLGAAGAGLLAFLTFRRPETKVLPTPPAS